jgi:hypothetical protein
MPGSLVRCWGYIYVLQWLASLGKERGRRGRDAIYSKLGIAVEEFER